MKIPVEVSDESRNGKNGEKYKISWYKLKAFIYYLGNYERQCSNQLSWSQSFSPPAYRIYKVSVNLSPSLSIIWLIITLISLNLIKQLRGQPSKGCAHDEVWSKIRTRGNDSLRIISQMSCYVRVLMVMMAFLNKFILSKMESLKELTKIS